MLKIILILFCTFFALNSEAQIDTSSQSHLVKKSIAPVTLISAGLVLNGHYSQTLTQKNIQNHNLGKSNIDDYLTFAPLATLYIIDVFGGQSKNGIATHSANLFLSEVIMIILNKSVEYSINNTGPDGHPRSFSSGHTAQAFVGATVLFHEYRYTKPFWAYSGFAFATAVGVLRITNDKHWYPDVLMGAGIGILSANIIYWINPFKNSHFLKKMDNKLKFGVNQNGLGMTYLIQ